jgi:RNA polymerase sigma-70 factor (ECF subfamily)
MENRAMTIVEKPATVAANDVASLDIPSLEGLFQSHHRAVFLAAYRVSGNVPDAEDVMQTVFLRLLKRAERQELMQNPLGYLCKSAINASLDQLRSKRRNPVLDLESDDENLMADSRSAVSDLLLREQRRQLRLALAELNPRAAEVFALRYFEEITNEQIAELLDTSASVVAVTLHRARSRLQELLSEYMLAPNKKKGQENSDERH